jgi:hypothetical protein
VGTHPVPATVTESLQTLFSLMTSSFFQQDCLKSTPKTRRLKEAKHQDKATLLVKGKGGSRAQACLVGSVVLPLPTALRPGRVRLDLKSSACPVLPHPFLSSTVPSSTVCLAHAEPYIFLKWTNQRRQLCVQKRKQWLLTSVGS